MSTATILKTPQEQVKDIQNYDRNILVETLITSPKDLQDSVNFFESLKNLPGANVTLLNGLQQDCMQIMIEKIKLTKTVLGVSGNTHSIITNPQLELNLEDKEVKESEQEEEIKPKEQMAKTEVKDNVIKHDFNKKNKQAEAKVINKDVNRVKNEAKQGFKGYTRKVIFGTDFPLSEEIQKLLPMCSSESNVDNIARHLINDGHVEEALNMSIDLFAIDSTYKKSQQEVEKRFLNEILPWAYGVSVKPFEDFQNVTLAFWNNHLIEIATSARLVEEITAQAVEEMKAGQITANTAIKVHTDFPNEKDAIFAEVCKRCDIKLVKIETAPMVALPKTTVAEEPIVTVGLTYETLQNECINKFKAGETFNDVYKFFLGEFVNVVDKPENEETKKLWAQTVILYKKSEKTVEEAEKAAYEGKDQVEEISKDQALLEAKNIIKKAIEAGENAMNKFRQFVSKKTIRNALEISKDNSEKTFKAIEAEVKAENPTLVNNTKEKKILLKNFNVEEKHPDVWESAKLCKTSEEFKDLLIAIVFDKTKELGGDNSWHVAANLTNQYINKFDDCKDWDDVKKLAFFHGVVNATAIDRKKAKKDAIATDAEIVEDIAKVEETKAPEEVTKQEEVELKRTEEPVKEATPETPKETESKAVDMKKFDDIMNLSNRDKIDKLIVEFLLLTEYKTYSERFNELRDKYLKGNKKWSGSKPDQRENTINKIVKDNPEIQKLIK